MLYKAIHALLNLGPVRKSGDIIARALQAPVTITQRGKPRLIMMSLEEYNRLRGKQAEKAAAGQAPQAD